MRVYSNREDLGACSNNLLYIRLAENFENSIAKKINLKETSKEIYIRLYPVFENSKILLICPPYIRGYMPVPHCNQPLQ